MHNESDSVQKGYKKVKNGPKEVEIPIDWKIKKLGELATIKGRIGWRGYTKKDLRKEGPITIGAGNITKYNKLNLSNTSHLSWEKYEESPEIKVKKGDILIVQRGSLGKIVHIDKKIGEATINPSMILLKNINPNSKYLYYYLCGKHIQDRINLLNSQTGVPMISQKNAENFNIILPPTNIQNRIAEILSTVDNAIAQTDEIIVKTCLIKEGLMQKLLTQGIGHSDFKKIKIGPKEIKIPEIWGVIRLGDKKYSNLTTGGTPSTAKGEYWGGKIPWMVSGEIHKRYVYDVKGRITEEGLHNSRAEIIPEKSVLVALNGQGRTKGTVAINFKKITVNQSIGVYLINQEFLNPFYVMYFLMTQYRYLRSLAGDSGRAGLNLGILKEIKIPLPPISEQNEISEIFISLENKIQKEKEYKQKLEELKKGLMQDLLTGKKRVTVENT